MENMKYSEIINDQTNRALWEVNNIIYCVPDTLWERCYCDMPLWKHVYHMLHSLDQWYINPRVYTQPSFHTENLNNLDVCTSKTLTREEINDYFLSVNNKIIEYTDSLTDDMLLNKPEGCEWTRFTLILAQHRHLHTHMGMIMGFIVEATGMWPQVVGLEHPIPDGELGIFA